MHHECESSQKPAPTATLNSTSACLTLLTLFWGRTGSHQPVQSQVSPRRLARLLLRSLNAKGSVLIWDYIVLIVGIEWLMLRRDIDLLCGQFDACEVFEQVGVVGGVEV